MILDLKKNLFQFKKLSPRMEQAIDFLQSTDFTGIDSGKIPIEGDSLFALVNNYETKEKENCFAEAHKRYIDLQYMISGNEAIAYAPLTNQIPSKEYDLENDYMLFPQEQLTVLPFTSQMFAIFFPEDIHMPCICFQEKAMIKKIVVKILIDQK